MTNWLSIGWSRRRSLPFSEELSAVEVVDGIVGVAVVVKFLQKNQHRNSSMRVKREMPLTSAALQETRILFSEGRRTAARNAWTFSLGQGFGNLGQVRIESCWNDKLADLMYRLRLPNKYTYRAQHFGNYPLCQKPFHKTTKLYVPWSIQVILWLNSHIPGGRQPT